MDAPESPFAPSVQPQIVPAEVVTPGEGGALETSSVTSDLREIFGWLYTHNPFYAISAALVFSGLRLSFSTSGSTFETGALMAGLTAYTLLLAASAWFLIRYGNLWEDVRTLLLLVVLMLLAISVSFDGTLAANSRLGIPLFVGGLAFAIGLIELLLRGIRLRLPAGFRLPLHATMAVFFLYPILLSRWIRDPDGAALYWGLFAFSAAAGIVFLTLLPAVRRGPGYVADNGSPWRWPLYPWTLFVVLGLGVCVRAYYLCVSLHFVGRPTTIFAPYFLVPFFWSVTILLLEIGLVSRLKYVIVWAMLMPIALMGLATTASPLAADDLGFLAMFQSTLGGSPLFFTLLAAGLFYLFAWARRVPGSPVAFSIVLAALAVCDRNTFNIDTLGAPLGVPILAAGMLYLFSGARYRHAAACLVGGWCVVAWPWIDFRDTQFAAYGSAIPVHLLLAVVLVVGALFRNATGRWIQNLGAVGLLLMSLAAIGCEPTCLGNPPGILLLLYPLLASALAVAYGLLVKNRWYFGSAAATVCGWLVASGWSSYRQIRRVTPGVDYLVCGLLSFLVALIVSLSKMGLFHRLLARWRRRSE